MPMKLPDWAIDKGVDFLFEAGAEVFGEVAADFFLGRRNNDDPKKVQFLDMLKAKDKEGLKGLIKTNPLGKGQGDEQNMEEDLIAIVVAGSITADESKALEDFFYSEGNPPRYCMNERERTRYRMGHMMQKNHHIRYRNLVHLAQLPDHKARRRKVGTAGKLDDPIHLKAWDYLTDESPAVTAKIATLKTENARKMAILTGRRPSIWDNPLVMRIRTRLGL